MEWFLENKEWVFNGAGVALVSALLVFFFGRKKQANIEQNGSSNVVHSGNGDINHTVNIGSTTSPNYRTEKRNGIKTTNKFDPTTGTETTENTGLD